MKMQIEAAVRGLSQHMCAAAREKRIYHFSRYLMIKFLKYTKHSRKFWPCLAEKTSPLGIPPIFKQGLDAAK